MKVVKYLILISILLFMPLVFAVEALAAPVAHRLAGQNRYETSEAVTEAGWTKSENVILATGEDFPDAICAAPLAKKLNAPILLTKGSKLSGYAESQIRFLGAKKVYIIGGLGAINDSVKSELEAMGLTCIRLGGKDRYETCIEVAKYMGNTVDQLAVVTGDDFPDALSVSPIAALKGIPVILMPKDYVPEVIKDYKKNLSIKKTYIIGGADLISDGAAREFPNAVRISGNDRYERNINIINNFKADINSNKLYIATGDSFPDALSGSAIAPKTSSAIILTGITPSEITREFIANTLTADNELCILGGEGAVSIATLRQLTGGKLNMVTIKTYYQAPDSLNDKNTIVINTDSGSEYVEFIVDGEIKDFELVDVQWKSGSDSGYFVEVGPVYSMKSVKDKTIVIKTVLPEGSPSKKIKWINSAGKLEEYIIAEYNLRGDIS